MTGNYSYETGSLTGILGQLKWETLKKRRKDNRLILLYKGLKGKASVPTDDLIPKTRRCRNQHSMAFQTPIANTDVYKVASSPRLSRIGMPSPILWSHPLKMQRIVLLSSLLWWELGTNSLITGPVEWLSFRRFTSKLSWSWSWPVRPAKTQIKLGIHTVWLEPSLFLWRTLVFLAIQWAHSERRLWSDWADAQAELSLLWAHSLLVLTCCGSFICTIRVRTGPYGVWVKSGLRV